jgi:ATP-dependent DNA helicase DinG
MNYIDEVFGPKGVFSQHFPGYEPRPGQVALASAVGEAMQSGGHLLAEGPCGTGKSISYLVPATWQAANRQKRVVVATANISLQEQLVAKDLPTLQKMLPWKFTFALLKGRNNYLCHDLFESFSPDNVHSSLLEQALALEDWASNTTRGDVSELPIVPDPRLWAMMSVTSETCRGDSCKHKKTDCCAEAAKARAAEADIVVTNYHMLFAHVMVRQNTGMDLVLPSFDLLVLDEIHEAVGIARDFFGFAISEYSYRDLIRKLPAEFVNEAKHLQALVVQVFGELRTYAKSESYGKRLKKPGLRKGFAAIAQADELQLLTTVLAKRLRDEATGEKARIAAGRAEKLAERLKEVLDLENSNKVYWLDVQEAGWVKLRSKPIDVSGILAKEIFDAYESVTVTSATVTTSGTFDFICQEMGAPHTAKQIIVDTPFNFEKQALLVVPPMPDPNDPDFPTKMADVLHRVVMECGGRTLGLFTSYKNMETAFQHLEGKTNGHRLMKQGQLPRTELTRIFKQDVNSVLLGTSSFWTGIDVSGEALTGLVIDRLPFGTPDDPIVDAINEKLGSQAFFRYLVPTAIIALRQGVGRLIRSRSDYGVIVVLDNRLTKKSYGKRFTRSLPKMRVTERVEDIGVFLKGVNKS